MSGLVLFWSVCSVITLLTLPCQPNKYGGWLAGDILLKCSCPGRNVAAGKIIMLINEILGTWVGHLQRVSVPMESLSCVMVVEARTSDIKVPKVPFQSTLFPSNEPSIDIWVLQIKLFPCYFPVWLCNCLWIYSSEPWAPRKRFGFQWFLFVMDHVSRFWPVLLCVVYFLVSKIKDY